MSFRQGGWLSVGCPCGNCFSCMYTCFLSPLFLASASKFSCVCVPRMSRNTEAHFHLGLMFLRNGKGSEALTAFRHCERYVTEWLPKKFHHVFLCGCFSPSEHFQRCSRTLGPVFLANSVALHISSSARLFFNNLCRPPSFSLLRKAPTFLHVAPASERQTNLPLDVTVTHPTHHLLRCPLVYLCFLP